MAEPLTFRPMVLETVVVMRGTRPVGTIRRYRAHRSCIVNVPGILTASMAMGKGQATFPTVAEAKRRLLELDAEVTE